MRFVVAFLFLYSVSSAQDFGWVLDAPFQWQIGGDPDLRGTDVTSSSAGQVSETPALESFVHRINVVNRGGSATCIAPGVYITCKHLFEGLRGYQVSIDGQAVAASVTMAPSHDVAVVVRIDEASAASVDTGNAPYMAECLAFGFGSNTVHRGVISNDDTLSLHPGESGIEQGDSGGAVFCDGKLVGVIRGKNPDNDLVCYFTPLSSVASLIPASGAVVDTQPSSATAPSKPSLRIALADFPCPPCDAVKAMDWSDFDVEWVTGGAESYPQISWLDKRGVRRVLTGAYTPSRVRWSWERTQ